MYFCISLARTLCISSQCKFCAWKTAWHQIQMFYLHMISVIYSNCSSFVGCVKSFVCRTDAETKLKNIFVFMYIMLGNIFVILVFLVVFYEEILCLLTVFYVNFVFVILIFIPKFEFLVVYLGRLWMWKKLSLTDLIVVLGTGTGLYPWHVGFVPSFISLYLLWYLWEFSVRHHCRGYARSCLGPVTHCLWKFWYLGLLCNGFHDLTNLCHFLLIVFKLVCRI
jgi:hypothetical protein